MNEMWPQAKLMPMADPSGRICLAAVEGCVEGPVPPGGGGGPFAGQPGCMEGMLVVMMAQQAFTPLPGFSLRGVPPSHFFLLSTVFHSRIDLWVAQGGTEFGVSYVGIFPRKTALESSSGPQ